MFARVQLTTTRIPHGPNYSRLTSNACSLSHRSASHCCVPPLSKVDNKTAPGAIQRASSMYVSSRLSPVVLRNRTRDHASYISASQIGSVEGLVVPNHETYAYSASKAALHHLSRNLAGRLGYEGITSNTLACGPFQSKSACLLFLSLSSIPRSDAVSTGRDGADVARARRDHPG